MGEQMLGDTWDSRDLPVLREAARLIEENDDPHESGVRIGPVAAAVGLDEHLTLKALRVLSEDGLVALIESQPVAAVRVLQVSAEARRLVGLWPTEQTALDRMINALEVIAANSDDEDTRSRAAKFGGWLKSSGNTVGLAVATAAVTGQMPL